MELKNVSFAYDDKPVIEDLSLDLSGGRRICVMGESGRGKTTLLKLMLGLIKPQKGEIVFAPGEKPSVVFQEDRLMPWFSAERNVREVMPAGSGPEKAAELLRDMELSESASKLPKELSGGMQRRVAIARALAYGGDPLLLDEPFKGLDAELRGRIAEKILLRSDGASILLISHDPHEAELLKCDETIRL